MVDRMICIMHHASTLDLGIWDLDLTLQPHSRQILPSLPAVIICVLGVEKIISTVHRS